MTQAIDRALAAVRALGDAYRAGLLPVGKPMPRPKGGRPRKYDAIGITAYAIERYAMTGNWPRPCDVAKALGIPPTTASYYIRRARRLDSRHSSTDALGGAR